MFTRALGEICFEIDLNIFQAIVNIAVEMNVDRIALISADHRATRSFLAEAANVGIRVDDIYEYKSFPTIFSQCKNWDMLLSNAIKIMNRYALKQSTMLYNNFFSTK